jgi:hypothetical protein
MIVGMVIEMIMHPIVDLIKFDDWLQLIAAHPSSAVAA